MALDVHSRATAALMLGRRERATTAGIDSSRLPWLRSERQTRVTSASAHSDR